MQAGTRSAPANRFAALRSRPCGINCSRSQNDPLPLYFSDTFIQFPAMSEQSTVNFVRSPVIWLTFVAIVAVSAAFYWQSEREQARQQFERVRVAAEQAELRRAKESEERRERERQRLVEEIRALKEAEEAQRQEAIVIRQSEMQKKQFVADDRYVSPQPSTYQSYQMQQDQWRRDYEDRNQRNEDESALYKARQEVERQKRYLQEREYEEQAARSRRDAAARYIR